MTAGPYWLHCSKAVQVALIGCTMGKHPAVEWVPSARTVTGQDLLLLLVRWCCCLSAVTILRLLLLCCAYVCWPLLPAAIA